MTGAAVPSHTAGATSPPKPTPREGHMDFSLFYFADDSVEAQGASRYDLLLDGARFADAHDLTAVWTPERHFHSFGGKYPNPSVTGAAVAAVTERIGIRAGSVNAPLHHPLRIAEEWAVVDNISHGRAGVSFASGWHPDDFALRPETFADRKAVMAETVRTVRKLWAGGSMSVETGTGERKEVSAYPPPVQREIPTWITCAGSIESFRLAGQLGAGVLTHLLGQDLDELGEKVAEYRRVSRETTGGEGHVALMAHTFLGDDTDTVRETVREPFSRYLRSSFGLIARSITGSDSVDLESMHEDDVEFLVARGFDRYFREGALFGTVADGADFVARVREVGVDEIACLIDFGVPAEAVLDGLKVLARLRQHCAR